jgi:hypothetical protein
MRFPKEIRQQNERLRADLGANPIYSWRWSDDILHVMTLLGEFAEETTPAGIIVMVPKTVKRRLLPENEHSWVLCALVETDKKDGSLEATGTASWVPVSGPAGPLALNPFELPNLSTTQYIIDTIRHERARSAAEVGAEWDQSQAQREKARWAKAYDQIRDAATAFYNVPGAKGHVSFPSNYGDPLIN